MEPPSTKPARRKRQRSAPAHVRAKAAMAASTWFVNVWMDLGGSMVVGRGCGWVGRWDAILTLTSSPRHATLLSWPMELTAPPLRRPSRCMVRIQSLRSHDCATLRPLKPRVRMGRVRMAVAQPEARK